MSFKEFIEYFCRIDLDDPGINKLPTAVCQECYYVLLNFCKFTITVEKLQNKFKNRLPQEHSEPHNKVSLKRKHEELTQKASLNKDESDQQSLALSNKRKKVSRTDEAIKVAEKNDNV